MWQYAAQAGIGLAAGLFGGLLGIGGSVVIIPGLIIYLSHTAAGYSGTDQHLIQASAMVCNVFVGAAAVLSHRRAGAIVPAVAKGIIPPSLVGIVLGVAVSNCAFFSQEKGRYLATLFAFFLAYVTVYNVWRFFSKVAFADSYPADQPVTVWKLIAVGFPTGLLGGLLGIGGGSISVPLQQLILKMPLRHAIANSAASIMIVSLAGAVYKNATIAQHGISLSRSLLLAGMLVPTAIVGSYFGSWLTHYLPRKMLRVIFVLFMGYMAWQTFSKSLG